MGRKKGKKAGSQVTEHEAAGRAAALAAMRIPAVVEDNMDVVTEQEATPMDVDTGSAALVADFVEMLDAMAAEQALPYSPLTQEQMTDASLEPVQAAAEDYDEAAEIERLAALALSETGKEVYSGPEPDVAGAAAIVAEAPQPAPQPQEAAQAEAGYSWYNPMYWIYGNPAPVTLASVRQEAAVEIAATGRPMDPMNVTDPEHQAILFKKAQKLLDSVKGDIIADAEAALAVGSGATGCFTQWGVGGDESPLPKISTQPDSPNSRMRP